MRGLYRVSPIIGLSLWRPRVASPFGFGSGSVNDGRVPHPLRLSSFLIVKMRESGCKTRGGFGFGLDFDPLGTEFSRPVLDPFPLPFGGRMTSATWMTMIVITGFVWGGFILVVVTAFRKESSKGPDQEPG